MMDWMNSTYGTFEFYTYTAWLWAEANWRFVAAALLSIPLAYMLERGINAAWKRAKAMLPITLSYEDKIKLAEVDRVLKRAIKRDLLPLGVKDVHLDIVRHHNSASVSKPAGEQVYVIEIAQSILRRLTEKQITAVALHEAGHIVQFLLYCQENDPTHNPYVATHRDEFEADFYAASWMGASTMINALKRVQKIAASLCPCDGCRTGVGLGTHPPISQRIHELRKWKREKAQAERGTLDADEALLGEMLTS